MCLKGNFNYHCTGVVIFLNTRWWLAGLVATIYWRQVCPALRWVSTLLILSGFALTIPLRCWCYVNQRFVFSASLCFLSSQTLLQNIIALNFPGKQIHLYWKNYWAIEILAKVSLIRQESLAPSCAASFDSHLLLICLILYVHFQPSFLNLPIM